MTTGIHGLGDTANLVYTADTRLSDLRVPQDLSVSTGKIVDLNVTTDKIADFAIIGDKINGSAISNAKLATNAVTTTKILDGNVTAGKIASDAISTVKIIDEAVTLAKLQTINPNKLLGRTTAGIGIVEEVSVTGTGSVLMSNSPTLITPNLGTPSAINLTNATAVPLSTTKVIGILEVVNGGTGTDNLTGLLKGNGTDPFTAAVNGTDYSLVREIEDQMPNPNAADQTSFTLSQIPNAKSKIKMFINGIKAPKGSVTVNGTTTATYVKSNNNDYAIKTTDLIEFVYFY
jgi:hypothetical protein